jgi:hypothetical protein
MRVLLYGLGDLGEKTAYALAHTLSRGDQLTVADRTAKTADSVGHMAAMVAAGRVDGPRVTAEVFSLDDEGAARDAFRRRRPEIVLFSATRFSWWRVAALPDSVQTAARRAGFAFWLPVHADLSLRMARLLRALDPPPWLLLAPYPDAVAGLVRASGYGRVAGYGNVDELAVMAAWRHNAEVRLVAHHSVEGRLFAGEPLPPYRLWIQDGVGWTPAALDRPFPWPPGTRSHVWTAASAVRLVELLAGRRGVVHVAGAEGEVGGYPCRLEGDHLAFDLPAGVTAAEAVAVNREAQRADGIERIDPDGTVWFTEACREGLWAAFGLNWEHLRLDEVRAAADALTARAAEAARSGEEDETR